MHKTHRARRVFSLLIAMMLATVGVTAASASPAMAASCAGAGCNNQDPQATGCSSGSYTTRSATLLDYPSGFVVGTIELRYSPACGTNWTRITSSGGVVRHMHLTIQRQGPYPVYTEDGNYSQAWTNMVYAPTPNLACGSGYAANSQNVGWDGTFCS